MTTAIVSEPSLAVDSFTGRRGDALIRVLDHDWLQNAVLRSAILRVNVVQVQVGVENQNLEKFHCNLMSLDRPQIALT